jgi:hypothetical protein
MQPSSVFCLPLLAVFDEVPLIELLLVWLAVEPIELFVVSWLVLEPIEPVELELVLGVCVLLPLG